eukprot:CAMPEP_0170649254 /NCGR_PEP_ID=MMETSP0224-20130122/45189_1 /TAXON_ID=285029 /ORGANISM="Togula jolla, Strain CCCM 725" /LENGTH=87 /DNA_ID=CAMNT_0010980873 /DNA_START=90 /DNA_END=349 /DNA_ORIENTATION=+
MTTMTTTLKIPEGPEFSWFTGVWGACDSPCGSGFRSREVKCTRTCSVYICEEVGSYECYMLPKPSGSESCESPAGSCTEGSTSTTLP